MIFHKLREALKREDNKHNTNPSTSNVHRFEAVEGKVSELNRVNLYWTPDTSNFPNIDAAIAIGDILYCLQYTISLKGHGFNYSTFVSTFWNQLKFEIKSKIQKIKVIFVLPKEPEKSYNVNVGTTDDYNFFIKGNIISSKPDKRTKSSSPRQESMLAPGAMRVNQIIRPRG